MPETAQKYLMTALKAALDAGKSIREVYQKREYHKELKADLSPVTDADRMAHAVILGHLEPTRLPVLSEEGRKIDYRERKQWQRFWLVDPLDGTKEFIRRNGEFTVNIALVDEQRPVMGIIYVPVSDLVYYSLRGSGAFRMHEFNRQFSGISLPEELFKRSESLPLQAEGTRPLRVVASRSHRNRETRRFIQSLRKKHRDLEIVSRGSALKFCLLAEGSADVYPRYGPTWEWDTGAGHAIAEAAGCRVSLHDRDEPLKYNKEDLLNPWFLVSRIS